MRYAIALALLVFLATACTNDVDSPGTTVTPTSAPAVTASPIRDEASPCSDYDFPEPTLLIDDVPVSANREAIAWSDPTGGCGINAHPFDTVYPAIAIGVPFGTTVAVSFDTQPATVRVSVWPIDISQLDIEYAGNSIGVRNGFDFRAASLIDLNTDPVLYQELDLTSLPPGDTILEIGATFPQGSISWNFRLLLGTSR
jgi:hypothetical protein